jgi:hypothetical protein
MQKGPPPPPKEQLHCKVVNVKMVKWNTDVLSHPYVMLIWQVYLHVDEILYIRQLTFSVKKNCNGKYVNRFQLLACMSIYIAMVTMQNSQFTLCNLHDHGLTTSLTLQTGNWCPNTRLGCQFPMRNTKWLKNGKLRKAILSAFYNISKRNFGILLILWCSFKLWWNFCLDQNFSYKGKGPLAYIIHYFVLV